MSLRVSALDGRVTLTVPPWTSDAEARAFVSEKRDWIARARARVPGRVSAGQADNLPFEGRARRIERASVRSARLSEDGARLLVPTRSPGRSLRRYLMLAARQRLGELAARYADVFDRPVAGIALRDTRSRWGSCSSTGRLSFSWRLIMAPPEVLDYVALHEAAHLVHMNHGAGFWALVERHCPDWRRHRAWLHAEGPALHAYDFDD